VGTRNPKVGTTQYPVRMGTIPLAQKKVGNRENGRKTEKLREIYSGKTTERPREEAVSRRKDVKARAKEPLKTDHGHDWQCPFKVVMKVEKNERRQK